MNMKIKTREMTHGLKMKATMKRRRVNMPQSNDEEKCGGFGLYELTLLNKMAVRERGGGQKVGYAQIPSSSSC